MAFSQAHEVGRRRRATVHDRRRARAAVVGKRGSDDDNGDVGHLLCILAIVSVL